MIAVIFEVVPAPGRRDAYLGKAADLRPLLDGIDGFLSIERFESLSVPGKVLSLSFWRDEEAVKAWRNGAEHRQANLIHQPKTPAVIPPGFCLDWALAPRGCQAG